MAQIEEVRIAGVMRGHASTVRQLSHVADLGKALAAIASAAATLPKPSFRKGAAAGRQLT